MLSFELTEDQQSLKEVLHRYAETDLRAQMRDTDETGQAPVGVLRKGWEMGVVPAGVDEAYGGFADAQPALTAAVAYEELGWGDLALGLRLLTPTLLAYAVREFGTEDQKQAYLPQVCNGGAPGLTAALVEPVYHFDAANLQTTAVLDGEDYVLNGVKAYVPLADGAQTVLVYANEGGVTQGFLVERNNPGLVVGAAEKAMGLKGLPVFRVELTDCRVQKKCRLGEDAGIEIGKLQARGHVAMSALAVGMARAALDYSMAYAKDRVAFGEPIASRQSIAFMLAEMAIEVDATRLMTWEAAWKLDKGIDATEDAFVTREYANDMVMEVADRALQILGGHGYVRDHPVELWFRNARAFANLEAFALA